MPERKAGRSWAALKGDDRALHDLATYLRSTLDSSGRTVRDIASELGFSVASMSKWLNGSTLPDEHVVVAVARACADPRLADQHADQARAQWQKAKDGQGERTSDRSPLQDPRDLVISAQSTAIDAQRRVVDLYDELRHANQQLQASRDAEYNANKMVMTLLWALGLATEQVRRLTPGDLGVISRHISPAEVAAADHARRRAEAQLDRARAEHHQAQQLVAAAEAKIHGLERELAKLGEPSLEATPALPREFTLDNGLTADLNLGLDRMNNLLDEQQTELDRLGEQLNPTMTIRVASTAVHKESRNQKANRDAVNRPTHLHHNPTRNEYLEVAWNNMRSNGFHFADERELGLPADFRRKFHAAFFTPDIIGPHDGDIPADRERAREVIRYDWVSLAQVELASYHPVDIVLPSWEGKRDFDRIDLLSHPGFREWTTGMLSRVPPEHRLGNGTFGVNLFRIRTQMDIRPNRDARFIVVYMLDKAGDGGETFLRKIAGDGVIAELVVYPGEFVIFDGTQFEYNASPLVGADARLDVLVCTVDYTHIYPLLD